MSGRTDHIGTEKFRARSLGNATLIGLGGVADLQAGVTGTATK